MNANIQNIILNFFNDDCNLVELKMLLDFIVVEENYNQFNEYVCINYISNLSMNQFDKSSIITISCPLLCNSTTVWLPI